jgi:type 1 glutamine amidotransferase
MSSFRPDFSKYRLVVLDYTGDTWPDETNAAFLKFVKSGGGVVVYHAADNAFPEWKEYNKIIGLGGWGNRTEKHGPYVYFKEGKRVTDHSPGKGGSHGKRTAFKVTNRITDHPITKGLPVEWMQAEDELYSNLRGPAENMEILSTAWSDPATGGSGKEEPVLMTISYGKGRVFHTVLGHCGNGDKVFPALESAGFIVTLQRGAEWAASGKVKQAVPEGFPGATTAVRWPGYKK